MIRGLYEAFLCFLGFHKWEITRHKQPDYPINKETRVILRCTTCDHIKTWIEYNEVI